MKLSEAAAEVIRLATARREYWDTELPKRHPDYPLVRAGERSTPPPPEDGQLRDYLLSLPTELVYKLIIIMYLGRGDFGVEGLTEEYISMKQSFPKPSAAATQMWGKVPLADYLRDGLTKLAAAGIDVDRLPLKPVRQRK